MISTTFRVLKPYQKFCHPWNKKKACLSILVSVSIMFPYGIGYLKIDEHFVFLFLLASLLKKRDSQTDVWLDLVGKPDEWCDYRESKQNGSVIDLLHSLIDYSQVVPFFFCLIRLSPGES